MQEKLAIDAKSQTILEECCRAKRHVLLAGDGLAITFQTLIVAVEKNQLVLKNRVLPEFIRGFLTSKSYSLQAEMVRFQADSLSSNGEMLLFPIKENSVIEETRQSERYSFSVNEKVIAEIVNPMDLETKLIKSVMDMSATGISIKTSSESSLFRPNIHLTSIKVMIDGKIYSQNSGKVVYNRKYLNFANQVCSQVGIQFTGAK